MCTVYVTAEKGKCALAVLKEYSSDWLTCFNQTAFFYALVTLIEKDTKMISLLDKKDSPTVEEQIMSMIPEELKNAKTYLEFDRSVRSVAYMVFTQNNLMGYFGFRGTTDFEKLVKEEPKVSLKGILAIFWR